jgi:RNA polymerase sigma-54 factor
MQHTPQSQLQLSLAHQDGQITSAQDLQWEQQVFYDIDNYGFTEVDTDEHTDLFSLIPTREPLAEELLQHLEVLVTPDDALIAEQLAGNLNERGYLEISPSEVAEHLSVPLERVLYVLKQLQTLEPLGIGARDLRECLLIQLEALQEQSTPHPLAYPIIDRYLDQLGHNQYTEIARQLKVSEQEVHQASHYIRSTLHPFPGQVYRTNMGDLAFISSVTYIHPDVIIRNGENGYEVELMEEKRYNFHIETQYVEPGDPTTVPLNRDIQRYIYQHRDRAHFFVDCIQRRWRTLKRVAEFVVDYQKDFLDKGIRSLLPLTRAEVAHQLHLDEGTVSRAIANKYALLPNGRLIPIADFFDGSLKIKDMLRELIQQEDPKHRLSDEEMARLLTAQNIPLARRTITKYREEMGIGSSRERNN